MLEHPPVITVGRRTDDGELHVPDGAGVEVRETDRGGKSTYHAPGQLVCYPILDLNRHGRDVKKYCRDLEEAVILTLAEYTLTGTRIDGLTGVWLTSPPRKICSIGVHVSRWVTTHGYALNVDLDPAPFTSWITACGLEDTSFTTMARELDDAPTVAGVRPVAAAAIAEVFGLALEELPAEDGAGLWPQPVHEKIGCAVKVDVNPIPRPGWDPLPDEGCVACAVGRVLVRRGRPRPSTELRFAEQAHDCHEARRRRRRRDRRCALAGEGFTIDRGAATTRRSAERSRARRPKRCSAPAYAWTEGSSPSTRADDRSASSIERVAAARPAGVRRRDARCTAPSPAPTITCSVRGGQWTKSHVPQRALLALR